MDVMGVLQAFNNALNHGSIRVALLDEIHRRCRFSACWFNRAVESVCFLTPFKLGRKPRGGTVVASINFIHIQLFNGDVFVDAPLCEGVVVHIAVNSLHICDVADRDAADPCAVIGQQSR